MVHLSCHFFILLYKKPSWNTYHPQFSSLPFENGLSWKLQLSYPEEEAICKWPPWRLPLSSLSPQRGSLPTPAPAMGATSMICYKYWVQGLCFLCTWQKTFFLFSYYKQACKSASFCDFRQLLISKEALACWKCKFSCSILHLFWRCKIFFFFFFIQ